VPLPCSTTPVRPVFPVLSLVARFEGPRRWLFSRLNLHGFSTRCVRFVPTFPSTTQHSLPAGWLTFTGRDSNPLSSGAQFQFFMFCYMLNLLFAWIYQGATSGRFGREAAGISGLKKISFHQKKSRKNRTF